MHNRKMSTNSTLLKLFQTNNYRKTLLIYFSTEENLNTTQIKSSTPKTLINTSIHHPLPLHKNIKLSIKPLCQLQPHQSNSIQLQKIKTQAKTLIKKLNHQTKHLK